MFSKFIKPVIFGEFAFIFFAVLGIFISILTAKFTDFKIDSMVLIFAIVGLGISVLNKLKDLEKANKKGGCIVYEKFSDNDLKDFIEKAKSRVWILTTWLPNKEDYEDLLLRIKKDANIDLRIILGNEDIVKQRESEFKTRQSGNFQSNLNLSSELHDKVRFTQFSPHMLCFVIDDSIFARMTLFNQQAKTVPSIFTSAQDSLGKVLMEHIEKLWLAADSADYVDSEACQNILKRVNSVTGKLEVDIVNAVAPCPGFDIFLKMPGDSNVIFSLKGPNLMYKSAQGMTGMIFKKGYTWRVEHLWMPQAERVGHFELRDPGPWMGIPIISQTDSENNVNVVGVVRLSRRGIQTSFTEEKQKKCEVIISNYAPVIDALLSQNECSKN